MNISRSHAEIIQVLHDADCALSEAEIAQRLNCTTCAKIITSFVLEDLLMKGIVVQAGAYQKFSGKARISLPLYALACLPHEYTK